MRLLKIYIPDKMHDPSKHFQDANSGDCIKCYSDLAKKCTPNCAACGKVGRRSSIGIICRNGDFEVGEISNLNPDS